MGSLIVETREEEVQLKSVYKKVIEDSNGDPLKLPPTEYIRNCKESGVKAFYFVD
jgi:predicted peroxiredoxin